MIKSALFVKCDSGYICNMSDIYRYGYGLSICYATPMTSKSTPFAQNLANTFLCLFRQLLTPVLLLGFDYSDYVNRRSVADRQSYTTGVFDKAVT